MAVAWRCRCGYGNVGVLRCEGCHRPSAGLRRQFRRRRVVSSAFIAISVMAAGALWSPARSAARAAVAPLAPPSTAPAPPPPQAPVTPGPRPARPERAARSGGTRPSRSAQRQPVAAPRAAAPAPTSARCTAARQAVENAGNHLPAGFDFRCPGSDYPRWGATSVSPCGSCFVSINTAAIGPNDAVLRYVIAHEFCHANGVGDELAADACAARYGFPNVYFKR